MSASSQKYNLKSLQADQGKTRVYLAEDLVVKRLVIFFELKKSSSEKEGRQFLLHARMLGQLKHPGLLPLYDMGVHDDRYFYTTRIPPGKHLLEHTKLSKSNKGILIDKPRAIPLVLRELSNTLSHLHGLGVTLGKLNASTVYAGTFGEVVIQDLSKVKKFDDLKSSEFKKAKADDLQLLGYLGMRLWLRSESTAPFSIREWDEKAAQLPLGLQDILDRCTLERGGTYPETSDLHHDFDRLASGQSPSSREGDIIFSIKGAIQKNKPVAFTSAALMAIFLFFLWNQSSPLAEIQKKLEQERLRELQLERSLGNTKEVLENLKHEQARKVEDHSMLADDLSESSKEQQNFATEQAQLKRLIDAKIKEGNDLNANNKEIQSDISKLEQQIAKLRLTQGDLRGEMNGAQTAIFSKQSSETAPITAFTYDAASPSLSKILEDDAESNPWLDTYFNAPRQSVQITKTVEFPNTDLQSPLSSGKAWHVWQDSQNLHLLKAHPEPELKSYPFEGIQFNDIIFSPPNTVIGLENNQLYHITLGNDSIELSNQVELDFQPNKILQGSTSKSWKVIKDDVISRGDFQRGMIQQQQVPEALDFKLSTTNKALALKSDGIYTLNNKQLHTLDSEPLEWQLLPKNTMFIRSLEKGELLKVKHAQNPEAPTQPNDESLKPDNAEQEQLTHEDESTSFTSLWSIDIPFDWNITTSIVSPNLETIWLNSEDGIVRMIHRGEQTPHIIHHSGTVISASSNHALLIDEQGFHNFHYQDNNQAIRHWIETASLDQMISSPALQWAADEGDLGLKVTHGRVLHLWDFSTDESAAVLVISPEDLEQVVYSTEKNQILAKGKNQYFSW